MQSRNRIKINWSLVRSKKNAEIGIINKFNRIFVKKKKKKIGMYIIGNIDCIVESESKSIEKSKKII